MKRRILLTAMMVLLCGCSQTAQTSETAPVQQESETTAETAASDTEEKQQEQGIILEAPVLSHTSGFYKDGFELTITAPEGTTIYYTTDGSEPTENSKVYSEPIKLTDRTPEANMLSAVKGTSASSEYRPTKNVKKCNVIRAIASDGSNRSPIVNGSYFVGIDEYPVPVISLKTDTSNLFNKDTGIYVLGTKFDEWSKEQTKAFEGWQAVGNYSQRGKEWERPVNFEWIDGDTVYEIDCGMRISGAASRSATQKSLRLTARKEYGQKNFKFPFIPDNARSDGSGEVEKYRSIILRNGGNDCDSTKLRDPVMQELASLGDYETMQYRPVVVYLDGEYWGMYTLTEDYSGYYIENNYSTEDGDVFDDNNIVIVKKGKIEAGEDEDLALYEELYSYIVDNDMSDSANYEKACSMMDMHSYADFLALSFYIWNRDAYYDNNNWAMWRVRETSDDPKADGRWRMMVYDIDFAAGVYSGGSDFNENNLIDVFSRTPKDTDDDGEPMLDNLKMMDSLLDNEDFEKELIDSLCDMRNICFERNRATDALLREYDIYSQLVPDTFLRFGPEWVVYGDPSGYYDEQVNGLASFFDGRYYAFPAIIKEAFDLGDTASIHITYDDSLGTVYVNGKIIPSDFKGIYFKDIPIDIKAVPSGDASYTIDAGGCTMDGTSLMPTEGAEIMVQFGAQSSVAGD